MANKQTRKRQQTRQRQRQRQQLSRSVLPFAQFGGFMMPVPPAYRFFSQGSPKRMNSKPRSTRRTSSKRW